jgi:hypothetical protein
MSKPLNEQAFVEVLNQLQFVQLGKRYLISLCPPAYFYLCQLFHSSLLPLKNFQKNTEQLIHTTLCILNF